MAYSAKKSTTVEVVIPEIIVSTAHIRIIGTTPLVTHKFSEKARRMMLDKQMKKAKSNTKPAKNPVEDFMGSLHWLTEEPAEKTEEAFAEAVRNGARFGFPSVGIKASIIAAAYRAGLSKNKVSLQGAFHIDEELVEIKGCVPTIREDMVRLETGVADVRHRAEFAPGWYMDLEIEYDEAMISLAQLTAFINRGGFSVGIGEHRIEKGGTWGRYRVALGGE